MEPKKILLLVGVGAAFVGALVLYIMRQGHLAGLLRAAAEGALVKHDLTNLKLEHKKTLIASGASDSRVQALDVLIAAKEREAVARPMKLKGADDAAIDNELMARGLIK